MTVYIRRALPSDQTFLEEMLYRSLYVPEGHEPFVKEVIRRPELAKYVAAWGKAGDLALIATLDSSLPVGAVWLRLLKGEEKGYGYVDDRTPELGIAVLPDYRGQGVGTRLLGQLFRDARPNYDTISLSVSKGNPAINLYKKSGFKSVREDETSVVMLKSRLTRLIKT